MPQRHRRRRRPAALVLLLAAACGGAEPAPGLAIDILPEDSVATQQAEPEPEPIPREPDLRPEERWQAPFAVSSAGEVGTHEPRRITIVGASPTIAEAMERLHSGPAIAVDVEDAVADEGGRTTPVAAFDPESPASAEPSASEAVLSDTRPAADATSVRAPRTEAATDAAGEESDSSVAVPPVDAAQVQPSAPAQREIMYRVGPADTLWGIARRYNVSPEQIREANRLTDERLRAGQMLIIPTGGS